MKSSEIRKAMVIGPTKPNRMRPLSDFTIEHRKPENKDEPAVDFADIMWSIAAVSDQDKPTEPKE